MMNIDITGWLAMDSDGTLKLHKEKPTMHDHDDVVTWWVEEDEGAFKLADTWIDTYTLIDTELAYKLCDEPMAVTINIKS